MTVDEGIDKVFKFLGIQAQVIDCPFRNYKTILKSLNGIYILIHNDEVYYVGKGQIRKRQGTHWKKANGDLKDRDPDGWRWLVKNKVINPKDWTVKYVILHKQTELSAVEGCLIHFFQPLANNETFIDEGRIV
jgi:hypothetical protein